MKICILGPVNNKNHFGGVATFTEGLAQGFLKEGHEVLIITDKDTKQNNVKVYKKINWLIFKSRIIKDIEDFEPDLLISSMWYGILNRVLKKRIHQVKTVHFIHGFPTYRYKFYKRYILNYLFKYFRKHTDFFVANSIFTSCINNEIYGIKCDRVIHIGLNEKYIEFEKSSNSVGTFIFVGRLVEEKNVDRVCEIFNYISDQDKNVELIIVGDGPEREKLEAKYNSKKIKFLGKRDRSKTLELLESSDIFISLNPHEPFGLVYLEAIMKKCKIICPNTGGQLEFLNNFDEVLFVDYNDYKKYKDDYINLINLKPYQNIDLNEYFNYFNYERVSKDLLKLIKKDEFYG